jgi:hypothetical protein
MDKFVKQEWNFYQDHARWYWRCHCTLVNNLDSSLSSQRGFEWLGDCLRDARAHGYRRALVNGLNDPGGT